MSRWADWDAIEAAQAQADREDSSRRARTPKDAAQPVEPPTYATPVEVQPSAAVWAAERSEPEPRKLSERPGLLEGLRLVARRVKRPEEPPPWER